MNILEKDADALVIASAYHGRSTIECLFVYGTLLPELAPQELRPLLNRLPRLGRATLPGRLYDLGPYPVAVPDAAARTTIWGEVFQLPDPSTVLPTLDAYEGCDPVSASPPLYARRLLDVTLVAGRVVPCWVYVGEQPPSGATLLPDGDYLRHCRRH